MKGVQGTDESRAQLHKWMDERRDTLRLSWAEIARAMNMTEENLLRIRKGQIGISRKAEKGIEDALQWERGSVTAAVERGVPPAPLASDEPPRMRTLRINEAAAVSAQTDPPADPPAPIDPAKGTLGDIQHELAYFRYRLRDTPQDVARLMGLLDLFHRLTPPESSTHGGLEVDAQSYP